MLGHVLHRPRQLLALLSNLTVNIYGGSGCQLDTDFWAVSQAAPLRRVPVQRQGVADGLLQRRAGLCQRRVSSPTRPSSEARSSTALSNSSWSRNSDIDSWSNGVWNQVFSGDVGAPAQAFGVAGGAGPYTTLATSPVTEEEPFLQVDSSGNYSVFVPAVQDNTSGTTWQNGNTPGTSLPIGRFVVANPATPVKSINLALAFGMNLILTPGVYDLTSPIVVSRPNTVVLGMGFPTLIPQNGTAADDGAGHPRRQALGIIFDAGPENSPVLLQLGTPLHRAGRERRRPDTRPGRVLPDRRRRGRVGDRQPRGRQLGRDPRRHLGVASRPRQRRRLDQQHGRERRRSSTATT